MSYAQGILKAVAGKSLTAETCNRLIRALDAIPEVFHADFVSAYFKEPDQEPEEKPEDYLAVKTFTSTEFHIGDEVIDSEKEKGIVTSIEFQCGTDIYVYVLYSCGTVGTYSPLELTRTGRNFPAIPSILEELKKG